MAKFIMFGKYSQQAIKGISKGRTNKALALIKKYGGRVNAVYALLGDIDLVVIADFPSMKEVIRAAIALTKLTGIGFSSAPAIPIEEFDRLVG